MKRKTAKKAARWWADHLRKGAKLDHGDSSLTGQATKTLAYMLQEQEKTKQTSVQIDAFEKALVEILVKRKSGLTILDVDYHPGFLLAQAAERANLKLGMTTLPWKTYMRIDGDAIEVACGYGATPMKL